MDVSNTLKDFDFKLLIASSTAACVPEAARDEAEYTSTEPSSKLPIQSDSISVPSNVFWIKYLKYGLQLILDEIK